LKKLVITLAVRSDASHSKKEKNLWKEGYTSNRFCLRILVDLTVGYFDHNVGGKGGDTVGM
jgi:hypothetical protein